MLKLPVGGKLCELLMIPIKQLGMLFRPDCSLKNWIMVSEVLSGSSLTSTKSIAICKDKCSSCFKVWTDQQLLCSMVSAISCVCRG